VIVAGQGTRPLPSWCCNLGTITNEAKTALLRSADVFVAPQLARESFGIVLLEAMASGVQIVASDLPSFVDVLGAPQDEQRLGEVFAVGDHRALARAVLEVLDCPDPLQASRARRTARSYDWSRVGATVLAIYRAVLSAAPTRRTLRGVG
jgi:phosphatidyl-myo-inositol alpha-mannosyltransferase